MDVPLSIKALSNQPFGNGISGYPYKDSNTIILLVTDRITLILNTNEYNNMIGYSCIFNQQTGFHLVFLYSLFTLSETPLLPLLLRFPLVTFYFLSELNGQHTTTNSHFYRVPRLHDKSTLVTMLLSPASRTIQEGSFWEDEVTFQVQTHNSVYSCSRAQRVDSEQKLCDKTYNVWFNVW